MIQLFMTELFSSTFVFFTHHQPHPSFYCRSLNYVILISLSCTCFLSLSSNNSLCISLSFSQFTHSFFRSSTLWQDFVIGLSALSRGTVQDKLRWIFSLYDLDGDGVLTKDELYRMISSIYDLLGRSGDIHSEEIATKQHAELVFEVSLLTFATIFVFGNKLYLLVFGRSRSFPLIALPLSVYNHTLVSLWNLPKWVAVWIPNTRWKMS